MHSLSQHDAHNSNCFMNPSSVRMKWYDATAGDIPEGKVPIQGGYEESGEQLYHALTRIDGFWVPGKTGKHLRGANFPYGGREVRIVSCEDAHSPSLCQTLC